MSRSEILMREAEEKIPEMRRAALRPATAEEVRTIIGSRFALFPQPQRSEGMAAAFWADYCEALSDLTPAQIEGGMKAHIADPEAEFLPKPGRLAELARKSFTPGRWTRAINRVTAAQRAIAANAPPIPAPEKAKGLSPSRDEMEAIMADFHAKMRAKEPPAPQKRRPAPPCGKPAPGSAMTPEMAALLNRPDQAA